MGGLMAPLIQLLDLDSHEMVPMQFWEREFGPAANQMIEVAQDLLGRIGENTFIRPDIVADDMEINEDSVWNHKGSDAGGPGNVPGGGMHIAQRA
jgi:hypothetical protein